MADVENINKVMMKGFSQRSVGSTLMNADSSRSHSIFTIVVEVRLPHAPVLSFSVQPLARPCFVYYHLFLLLAPPLSLRVRPSSTAHGVCWAWPRRAWLVRGRVQCNEKREGQDHFFMGKLNLVDLAGSERQVRRERRRGCWR